MSGEYIFDEVITPSLTLEPELEPVVETTLVAQPEKEEAEGPVLTPEEEAMVAAFAEKEGLHAHARSATIRFED